MSVNNLQVDSPAADVLKVNVDLSFVSDADTFKVGMVLRNHDGEFLAGQTSCFEATTSVFEAEVIGVREALSWIKFMQFVNQKVELESDSLLVVNGVVNKSENLLEVGEVIEQIKLLLEELVDTSLHFVRNQANRPVAHGFARLPCLVNCHVDLSSLWPAGLVRLF